MTIIRTIRRKKTYSTFTKYCYQKDTLPKALQQAIPRSTRYSWCKQHTAILNDHALASFEKESLEYVELSIEKENAASLSASLGEI